MKYSMYCVYDGVRNIASSIIIFPFILHLASDVLDGKLYKSAILILPNIHIPIFYHAGSLSIKIQILVIRFTIVRKMKNNKVCSMLISFHWNIQASDQF